MDLCGAYLWRWLTSASVVHMVVPWPLTFYSISPKVEHVGTVSFTPSSTQSETTPSPGEMA